jgi:hypothetical protein
MIISQESISVRLTTIAAGLRLSLGVAADGLGRSLPLTSTERQLANRIKLARRDALVDAQNALQRFMRMAKLDANGQVEGNPGSARLMLCMPKMAFRKAALSVGLIRYGVIEKSRLRREFPVMEFQIPAAHPAHVSIHAQTLFCVAAGVTMQTCFPFETWIVVLAVRGLTPNNSGAANWEPMLEKHIGSTLRKAGRTSGDG